MSQLKPKTKVYSYGAKGTVIEFLTPARYSVELDDGRIVERYESELVQALDQDEVDIEKLVLKGYEWVRRHLSK